MSYVGVDATHAPPAEAEEGTRYVIERLLGEGAEGRVYLARDTDLCRRVAMKVIRSEVANSVAHLERFLTEARRTSSLQHSGVPSVYDLGYTQGGELFFTMRVVEGRSLEEVLWSLRDGDREAAAEWTLSRLVLALEQVSNTVNYAHSRGLVHRDLKPANIAVGKYGEVLVLDWGLSKRIEDDPEALGQHSEIDVAPTRLGTVKGTPLYMSPEQALGDVHRIDARTDVFSLGAMLYEMLCLWPPYEGETMEAVILAASDGQIRDPHERAPDRPMPDILVATAMRALSIAQRRRHATAGEFAEELRRYLQGGDHG